MAIGRAAGRVLKRLRLADGDSLLTMSARLGLASNGPVYAREEYDTVPSLRVLIRYAEIHGLTPGELLDRIVAELRESAVAEAAE